MTIKAARARISFDTTNVTAEGFGMSDSTSVWNSIALDDVVC